LAEKAEEGVKELAEKAEEGFNDAQDRIGA